MGIIGFLCGNPWGMNNPNLRRLERIGPCPYCNAEIEVPMYTRTGSNVECDYCDKIFKFIRNHHNYFTSEKVIDNSNNLWT